MEIKIYDKISYRQDIAAKNIESYIKGYYETRDENEYECYYKEPDYKTKGELLPTFTILDKKYGIIIIKAFNYDNEELSFMSNKHWIKNGQQSNNEIKSFQDYCYYFEKEVYTPSNEIESDITFTKIVIFPSLNNKNITNEMKVRDMKIIFDDFRTFDLNDFLEECDISDRDWKKITEVFQKAHILNKDCGVEIESPAKSYGEAILINNQKINYLDNTQLDASWSISDEPEQIRGLAGTGKTVILSIKAAKLHRKFKDKKIAYVFYTHSLYNQVNRLVNNYYHKITGQNIDPEKLQILHAWGGKTTGAGLYYNVCLNNGIAPLNLGSVKGYQNPFGEICKRVLNHNLLEEYDYILVDEAQDMPAEFFKFIEKILKKPAKVIVAYDELQTTNDTKIPKFNDMFNSIELKKENDHILKRSYRNDLKVLMTAFAFGFGLYSQKGVTQVIKDVDTWEALGFEVKDKEIKYNKKVKIFRNLENSPNKINDLYPSSESISLKTFSSKEDEIEWISEKIVNLIKEEGVKPEDIMVINMSSKSESLTRIQNNLYGHDIESTIPGVNDSAKAFMIKGCVTLTTPRRAKGNEVSIVFVLGAENIYNAKSLVQMRIIRNMLFVSITRSKGWVFVSGSGDLRYDLEVEFDNVMKELNSDQGSFEFIFPDKERCEKLASIDYIVKDGKKEKELQAQLQNLANVLSGDNLELLDLMLEDEMKEKLIEFVSKLKKED